MENFWSMIGLILLLLGTVSSLTDTENNSRKCTLTDWVTKVAEMCANETDPQAESNETSIEELGDSARCLLTSLGYTDDDGSLSKDLIASVDSEMTLTFFFEAIYETDVETMSELTAGIQLCLYEYINTVKEERHLRSALSCFSQAIITACQEIIQSSALQASNPSNCALLHDPLHPFGENCQLVEKFPAVKTCLAEGQSSPEQTTPLILDEFQFKKIFLKKGQEFQDCIAEKERWVNENGKPNEAPIRSYLENGIVITDEKTRTKLASEVHKCWLKAEKMTSHSGEMMVICIAKAQNRACHWETTN